MDCFVSSFPAMKSGKKRHDFYDQVLNRKTRRKIKNVIPAFAGTTNNRIYYKKLNDAFDAFLEVKLLLLELLEIEIGG